MVMALLGRGLPRPTKKVGDGWTRRRARKLTPLYKEEKENTIRPQNKKSSAIAIQGDQKTYPGPANGT